MLILHYTGMQTARAAVDRLRDTQSRVSSHYVINEDGGVLRLVPEAQRAWHAGVSFWQGRRMLNDCSIGIEIVNPGHEWGYRPFPPAQMRSVRALCLDILARHAIPPDRVLGHSDVAPDRKQDPGELFDWRGLASDGIGLWPQEDADGHGTWQDLLAEIGYDISQARIAATAFQRHWMPERTAEAPDDALLRRAAGVLKERHRQADT
jgi:N-acetylmuramoyl-L-alanine amidase